MEGFSGKTDSAPKASDQTDDPDAPWQISINELALDNYGLILENRTLAKPLRLTLEPISLNLRNFSIQKDSKFEVGLEFNVDKTGAITVNGLAGIDPLTADLSVGISQLDLKPLQSYIDTVAQLELINGTADLKGTVKYDGKEGKKPEMTFRGSISVNAIQIKDQAHSGDFVNWDAVSVNGIQFDFSPNKLDISEVVIRKPYARIVIWPDGTVNVTDAFSAPKETPADDAVYAVERPVSAVEAEGEGPMPITIDSVRIENGSANYTDLSFKPGFTTGIQQLTGTINGLTSETLGRADVKLEGKVDKYAPMKIFGKINPLSEDAYTDLTVMFKNIELATATPYSSKFVGYTIQRGKLSLDLKYKLSEKVLIGENKILLDQFTFGDETDSPDATSLPVKLAVSLLKDRHGKIDVDLPVRGDLNDPEFSYGATVLKALTNLIVKITASPFAALGRLAGIDGDDLGYVAFEFGSSVLEPSQKEKLDKLAEVLNDRPTLELGVKGVTDAQYDRLAMAEEELLHQLKIMKSQEMQVAGKSVPEKIEVISISDQEYPQLLIKAYEARFGELPGASAKEDQKADTGDGKVSPVLIAEAKQRLIKSMPVDAATLEALARERAAVIKGYLVQEGGLKDQQVPLADIEVVEGSGEDRMHNTLTLSGT